MIGAIVAALANIVSALAIAPLLDGFMRKLIARIHSRQGPPITQSYRDLLKLLGKEDIESGEVPGAQRAAAILALGAVLTAACLTPMGVGVPLGRYADGIMLLYVLTLCAATTAFAGLAAGSTYSLVGVSREMMADIVLEPLFAVTILAAAVQSRSLRLETLLNGSVYGSAGVSSSGILLLIVMALGFQAYAQRQPFDITEAETEIMEGPLLEYSGPKLALFRYASMVRLAVYASLFIGIFVPWGARLPVYYAWPIHWVKVLVIVLAVAVVAAVHARVRIDQALGRYAGLFAVSMAGLVLAAVGY